LINLANLLNGYYHCGALVCTFISMINEEPADQVNEIPDINHEQVKTETSSTPTDESSDPVEMGENEQPVWDLEKVEKKLIKAYENNSETEVLAILKDNSFLFYDLFSRKYAVQPIFRELNFGGNFRCDFAWLNDNSSGPEWVVVEIEKPKMELFRIDGRPTAPFQAAIEQVKNWDQYFRQNQAEMRRIFGAVAQFRFVLVTGSYEEWQTEHAQKWRMYHHQTSEIEIRSMQTFFNSIEIVKNHPGELWSFEEHPKTLSHSKLKEYWQNYEYMDRWRQITS